MKIRLFLSHVVIILSICFLAFAVLDWFNPMMNFSGNAISSKLLLVLCVSAVTLGVLTILPCQKAHKDTAHTPRPVHRQQ